MNNDNLRKAWYEFIKDIDNSNHLDSLCKAFDINPSDFVAWVACDRLRKAKWNEIQETRSSRKEVK